MPGRRAASSGCDELLEQHRPKPGETDLRGFEWHYLHRLCHSELLTLKKPHARNWTFSPDGKRLALSGGVWDDTKRKFVGGEITVLDVQTGQELLILKGIRI